MLGGSGVIVVNTLVFDMAEAKRDAIGLRFERTPLGEELRQKEINARKKDMKEES